VQALDYLLKPVEEERFRRAVDRARAERGRQAPKARAEELERRLRALLAEFDEHRKAGKSGSRYRERLMVSVGTRSVIVETASIDWIGARDYCAELHVGGKSYAVRETLGALEAALDPASFVRSTARRSSTSTGSPNCGAERCGGPRWCWRTGRECP
jgi:two-component system, LytTR family, response regulator